LHLQLTPCTAEFVTSIRIQVWSLAHICVE
jgi:hypothetical protein